MSSKQFLGGCVVLLMAALFSLPSMAADKRIGILVDDDVLTSDVTAPAEVLV